MTVCKRKYFYSSYLNAQAGSSTLETLLAISVVLAVSPILYNQIADMTHDVQDMAMANQIVKLRDGVINFVRVNHNQWKDTDEIKLEDADIQKIAPMAHSVFVDKYKVNGATITDVYLAFNIDKTNLRVSNIARYIGQDAAVVREDNIAYGQSWAVSAPEDFNVGDLIYKISRDFDGEDKTRFLHRATMGEDGLNKMQRDLYMNNFNLFDVGNITALSAKILDVNAIFVDADVVDTDTAYFESGAILKSKDAQFGSVRVTGDVSGFRKITANILNDNKYTTNGRLVVDSATVDNSVNVANNLVLKSASAKTVTGFDGISANKLFTPYISTVNMFFYEGFGITVSGELLLTSISPLQIGSWSFPTTTPPSFSKFEITRIEIPQKPNEKEFEKLISKDWQL